MSGKVRLVIGIAAFAVFIGAAVFAYRFLSEKALPPIEIEENPGQVQTDNGESEREKIEAPDFTVQDGSGNSIKLSDLRGTPVVVNFWASWCPPCKSEMPGFDNVWKEMGSDVAFMMVDLVDGQRETMEKGAQYVAEEGFSFPVYFDVDQEAAMAYGVSSIPTTVLIGSDGYIVTGVQGAIDEPTLLKGVEYLLEYEERQD